MLFCLSCEWKPFQFLGSIEDLLDVNLPYYNFLIWHLECSPVHHCEVTKNLKFETVFPFWISSGLGVSFDVYKVTDFEFVRGSFNFLLAVRLLFANRVNFFSNTRAYLMDMMSRRPYLISLISNCGWKDFSEKSKGSIEIKEEFAYFWVNA